MIGERIAALAYLLNYEDNPEKLARVQSYYDEAVLVFRGWLGDRNAYADFIFDFAKGADKWMPDPQNPTPVNPVGSMIQGHNVDGVLPDDQRRAVEGFLPPADWGEFNFHWPPTYTHYTYGALEGAVVQAEVLHRRGYTDVWNWSNQALKRAVSWLWYDGDGKTRWDTCDGNGESNKRYILDIIDRAYDASYIPSMSCYYEGMVSPIGRNVAWTSWTHGVWREMPSCNLGPWVNQGCAQGTCVGGQRLQTRNVEPLGCDTNSQCVPDSKCRAKRGEHNITE